MKKRYMIWVRVGAAFTAMGCAAGNGSGSGGGANVLPPGQTLGGVSGSSSPAGKAGSSSAGTGVGTLPVAGNGGVLTAGAGGRAGTDGVGAAGTGGVGAAGTGGVGAAGTGGVGAAGTGGTPAMGVCTTPNLMCKPAAPASTGDPHQDCVDRINQFRTTCACLQPLARWTDGEACADMMANYDSTKPNPHQGFMDKICSGGNSQDECPGYRSNAQVVSSCLQLMWNEGPPPTTPCTGSCFQMYGHYINMTTTSNTKVACGFFTTPSGQIWSVQNFSR
jgi:hypothetical protein